MTSQTKDAAFNAKLGRMKKAELIALVKGQRTQLQTMQAYQGDSLKAQKRATTALTNSLIDQDQTLEDLAAEMRSRLYWKWFAISSYMGAGFAYLLIIWILS